MNLLLLFAGIFFYGILLGQNDQIIYVRLSWTADVCQTPLNRQAIQDLRIPQSAAGLTLYFLSVEKKEVFRLEADAYGGVRIPAVEGMWQVFAPEKKRHYGSVAEKDSVCIQWKLEPNVSFSLKRPLPDTLFVSFHRTCPPCRIPLPITK